MRLTFATVILALLAPCPSEAAAKTLVVLTAHADDEAAVAPILARYAREGVRVHLIIATDGGQGTGSGSSTGRDTPALNGDALVATRTAEALCSADALGISAPIFLGFPDGRLGDYAGDRTLIFRLTDRIANELQRIQPDAVLTWGPDGGTGHPDHRIVSSIATQLLRAGAAGMPDRLLYMSLTVEMMRMVHPRGEPPLVVPIAKYFTVEVPFEPRDLEAARRAMLCHRSQLSEDVVKRVAAAAARVLNGRVLLAPAFAANPATDVFPRDEQRR
jgi:N-acetyl-1-D-myo-inositol-2-amino-2-deoxy-alpha-D-glucopyranoside deacetylase